MHSLIQSLLMPGTYFNLVQRSRGADPLAARALREGTGVGEAGAPATIEVRQQLRQLHNLHRLEQAGWGLQLGTLFDAPAHGAVGVAMLTAPTMREALQALASFGSLRTPFLRLGFRREANRARLEIRPAPALTEAERVPLLESTVVSVQRLVRQLIGESLEEASTELGYPRPAHASRYADHVAGRVRFDCSTTMLSFPSLWLDARSPLADAALHDAALRGLAGSPHPRDRHPLVARAELLVACSTDVVPTVAAAASQLFVSKRTLERRLRAAGTTYRALSDDERRKRARALLERTDLDVAAISDRLGYGDPANFGRACRRWFGLSPRGYRRRLPVVSTSRRE